MVTDGNAVDFGELRHFFYSCLFLLFVEKQAVIKFICKS